MAKTTDSKRDSKGRRIVEAKTAAKKAKAKKVAEPAELKPITDPAEGPGPVTVEDIQYLLECYAIELGCTKAQLKTLVKDLAAKLDVKAMNTIANEMPAIPGVTVAETKAA